MIARIWHGKTRATHYEGYSEFLKKVAIPDYKCISGLIDLIFLRRIENNEAHYTLITLWENSEAIKKFAGDDICKAKYYPEDVNYLLDFEEFVTHFEVFGKYTAPSISVL